MNHTLGDLNGYLFEQMERLNNEELNEEEIEQEVKRAKAVSDIADKVISNGSLVLDAQKYTDGKWNANAETPRMLKG